MTTWEIVCIAIISAEGLSDHTPPQLRAAIGRIDEMTGVDPGGRAELALARNRLSAALCSLEATQHARDAERKIAETFHENGLTGPLREQYHDLDFEGAGRSHYWDTPTAERAKHLPEILKLSTSFSSGYDVEFAKGWLAEMRRAQDAKV